MTSPKKILLVDDDLFLLDVLKIALEDRFLITVATDGASALRQLLTVDLILLDLTLPDIDGMLLIGKIRGVSQTPIIVLSARAGQFDRVLSLKMGADDFIAKPFDLDDLDARIDAVLRRSGPKDPLPRSEFGSLSVTDTRGCRVDDKPLHMTPTEQHLLAKLVAGQGAHVTPKALAESVWGIDDRATRHVLDTHLWRLRQRLLKHRGAPSIHTKYGHGYALMATGA